jgi:hypothetical protein
MSNDNDPTENNINKFAQQPTEFNDSSENNVNVIRPAEFLEDKTNDSDEEAYIKPDIETKLSKEKRMICRDIVKEINHFGVEQRQKLYLIYLLALELENRDAMLAIVQAVKSVKDKIDTNLIQID